MNFSAWSKAGKKPAIWMVLLTLIPVSGYGQVDTTGLEYKTGYYIGAWLPFIILAIIGILVYRYSRKRNA
jgi:lipopolysaccharide export LptBFGC system permease protein LptF